MSDKKGKGMLSRVTLTNGEDIQVYPRFWTSGEWYIMNMRTMQEQENKEDVSE